MWGTERFPLRPCVRDFVFENVCTHGYPHSVGHGTQQLHDTLLCIVLQLDPDLMPHGRFDFDAAGNYLTFGAMQAGAGNMQILAGLPVQMVDVLQAVILLFLTAEIVVRRIFRVRGQTAELVEMASVSRSYGGGAP